jgi:putative oxidoreductase
MRVVVGIALVVRRIIDLRSEPPIGVAMTHILAIAVGTLLLIGLWTPIAGTFLAIIEVWSAFSHPRDPWSYILLGTLGAALALLGPGAWSADARLFGWKRIDLPNSKITSRTPKEGAS